MKTNSNKSVRLFQDRPLPETPRPTPLYMTGFDKTDHVDSWLRVFLAVSLLGSLVLCSRELSGPPSKTVVHQTTNAAASATCCVVAAPGIRPAVL